MDEKKKEKKNARRRLIIKEIIREITCDASSQGNDFSLGGDDEIDVDGCG